MKNSLRMLKERSFLKICSTWSMVFDLFLVSRHHRHGKDFLFQGRNALILEYQRNKVRMYDVCDSPSAMLMLLIRFDEIQTVSGLFLEK